MVGSLEAVDTRSGDWKTELEADILGMTPEILMTLNRIDLDGEIFLLAEELPIPEWPCVLSERSQPTLTLKDDDVFLVTDTLGIIDPALPKSINQLSLYNLSIGPI